MPALDDSQVQISIPVNDASLPSTIIQPTDETLQRHHSSQRHSGRNTRISMDLSSKGTLSFRNISYVIGRRQMNNGCKKWYPFFIKSKSKKQIIDDVSGIFTSGMNAIMGPTGCGKSSLLDILAYRKDHDGLSGQVFIDGYPPPSSYKYTVGYVVQDDIISGALTVRENLMFSANVRLSDDVSNNERKERVTKVIHDLGLEACADTKIGTEFLRGVSGGERKRTCIGMELVLSPKILFLDEPTTGLDASTARNVMECLRELSKSGRTIIFSIHQPRYSIFKLFDSLLLMCKGKSIYHGPALAVLPYFNTQGYSCELHDNPADFALDVLIDASRQSDNIEKLNKAYRKSQIYENIGSLLKKQVHEDRLEKLHHKEQEVASRSLFTEIAYVSQRTLKNTIRNPELFLSQVLVAIILAVLVGLVFNNMEKTIDPGVHDRLGAIFFIVVSQIFSTITALEPLIKERALFIHENISGYYRTTTYFIAKLICDVLPMRVIPSIIFSLIGYFMTGLQRSVGQFFIFLLTIFMASIFGSAICFFISATIHTFAVALIVVILIFVVMFLFSGFLISLDSIFNWLSWIQWISAVRYASNVLIINEFRNINFCQVNQTDVCPMNGSEILKKKAVDYATDWDMWKYLFALTMMTIGFLLLAYIQLLRIKKSR
ncbi:unnamed protein product [Rotaria sordida]|uniref:ABC transporter domain-containing protein n=2 Tax=Rotaria sordida TaxID=392033 RepID=A0A815GF87_9BILA|nr:unnamed protein product [Rotaria sordida]CAF1412724.1 unnamed protein product [Rotaria sordida]CAF3649279.1 unnamed protein product [Rotaria sordida]